MFFFSTRVDSVALWHHEYTEAPKSGPIRRSKDSELSFHVDRSQLLYSTSLELVSAPPRQQRGGVVPGRGYRCGGCEVPSALSAGTDPLANAHVNHMGHSSMRSRVWSCLTTLFMVRRAVMNRGCSKNKSAAWLRRANRGSIGREDRKLVQIREHPACGLGYAELYFGNTWICRTASAPSLFG